VSYLITGGCGFVGSNLAAHLIRQSEEVVVFDNLSRVGSSANLEWLHSLGTFEFVHGDTRDPFALVPLLERRGVRAVFHLAGQVAMTTSMQSPRKDFESNVLGSINLLETVRRHSPETIVVYASSNKVYGGLAQLNLVEQATRYAPAGGRSGVDESAGLEFHTPYGCSKGAADQYVLDYARCFGLNTVVFRHSTIYGGRQYSTYDQGWVGWFCRQAIEIQRQPQRESFTICGDGKQVRDLLHASDAVRCYMAAVENVGAARGQAFNIGGGMENSLSLLELFSILERRFGIQMRYRSLPWRLSDQKFFVADNGKAQRLLQWKPVTSKEAGIEDVIQWEMSREA
jgi:CDP-paratose 2-epimerase